MATISIHPCLAGNVRALEKVQFETGLRAVYTGSTFGQLAAPGAARATHTPRPKAPVAVSANPRWRGELCICTHCERTTNTQFQGEKCWYCNTGRIVRADNGGNGGSAA